MAGKLDGAGFMHRHMAVFGGQHPFSGAEHRVDDQRIGLGAAHQKEYVCLGAVEGGAELLLGRGAVGVLAIAALGF